MLIKIVFEDENILVVDKPAGLLVHPVKDEKNTLVDWLLQKYPSIKNVGENNQRPGIVHRLDKDTSGLLVIAKNQKSFKHLKNLFEQRQIDKRYLALVVGQPKNEQGIIVKSISRSKRDPRKRTVLLTEKSRSAKTEYQVLKSFVIEKNTYSLLEVKIQTGRTHQIRVHLAAEGYPVAGDQQYKFKRQPCPKNLTRQFLHAAYLKFNLIDGKIIELKSELPPDLKNIIE